MKKYRIETREVSVLAQTFCDRCGAEVVFEPVSPWTQGSVETNISYSLTTSTDYTSYGDGWYIDDLCVLCASLMREILEKNDFVFKEYDW